MPTGVLKGKTRTRFWLGKKEKPIASDSTSENDSPLLKDSSLPRTFWIKGDTGSTFGMGVAVEGPDYPSFGSGWIKVVELKDESST